MIPLVAQGMRTYPDVPSVQDTGCAVIAVLASSDLNKQALRESNCLELLSTAVAKVRDALDWRGSRGHL